MNKNIIHTTSYLKRRNFSAELPVDFVLLVSMENQYGHLPNDEFMEQGRLDYLGRYNPESFFIRENKIYFSGNFSNWWIIRIWQRFIERLFPLTYKIKYINYENWKNHICNENK